MEAATRLIRDINGGQLDLPHSQIQDVKTLCLNVLNFRPVFRSETAATSWTSQTEKKFGEPE